MLELGDRRSEMNVSNQQQHGRKTESIPARDRYLRKRKLESFESPDAPSDTADTLSNALQSDNESTTARGWAKTLSISHNIVSCTQHYAYGLNCSHGTPCQPCEKNKKRCRRKRCSIWDRGQIECGDRHCPFAHPEHSYSNAVHTTAARRDMHLSGVSPALRW